MFLGEGVGLEYKVVRAQGDGYHVLSVFAGEHGADVEGGDFVADGGEGGYGEVHEYSAVDIVGAVDFYWAAEYGHAAGGGYADGYFACAKMGAVAVV